MFDIATILLGAVVIGFVYLYRYMTRNHGTLEALGIPVVKPVFMFGSPPFNLHQVKVGDVDLERMKKYGRTWGAYDGTTPTVFTMDPDFLKTVLIKEAESFSERMEFPLPDKWKSLDITSGEVWHQLRKALSPTFTSGKLRSMMEPIGTEIDKFIAFLKQKSTPGEPFEVKRPLQALACGVIAKCAFGVEVNYLEKDDELFKIARDSFSSFSVEGPFANVLFNVFAHFKGLTALVMPAKECDYLVKFTGDIIKDRESKPHEFRGDFMDRLRDIKKLINEDKEAAKVLNEDLILAQGIVFFTAGFETTSNTLGTVLYNMAKHPDLQQKAYKEVIDVLDRHGGDLGPDSIAEMHYLEAFIQENLRLNPPAPRNLRLCTKDTKVGDMLIKKGTAISPPIYAMHRNPDFFPDPDTFNPDRFLPENANNIIPLTYHAFGGGLRVCIGMRFAMIEMKMIAAKLLLDFEVVDTPETKLNFDLGSFFINMYSEMKVGLRQRTM